MTFYVLELGDIENSTVWFIATKALRLLPILQLEYFTVVNGVHHHPMCCHK